MADLQRRCAEFSTPENEDGLAVITGKAPVAEMRGCAREVTAYTRGAGRLSCMPRGYAPCHNTEAVLEAIGYQPDADTENPADSVFCSHGAGYLVKWDEVPAHAHVASGLGRNAPVPSRRNRKKRMPPMKHPMPAAVLPLTAAHWSRTKSCWRFLSAPMGRSSAGGKPQVSMTSLPRAKPSVVWGQARTVPPLHRRPAGRSTCW